MKHRKILIGHIVVLLIANYVWKDELYSKLTFFTGDNYEYLKIVLHSSIAYKTAKWITVKYKSSIKNKGIDNYKFFIAMFVILNSYIIIQYASRIVSHKIINSNIRETLNDKIFDTQSYGWGVKGEQLTYSEYIELNKSTSLPKVPKSSSSIHVHYQFGMQDYDMKLGFKTDKNFNPEEFYSNDTFILNRLLELKLDTSYYYNPPKFDPSTMTYYLNQRPNWVIWSYGTSLFYDGKLDFDTTSQKYYLWLDYEI